MAARSLLARRQRRHDYRQAFGGEAGSRVLRDLFRFCRMDQPSMVVGDPHMTAYQEGMRRVFLRIAAIMRQDDETLLKLMEESDHD